MARSNLRKKSNLQHIFDKGEKFVCKSFVAFYLSSDKFSHTIIASKKVGNAVARNRAKRRLREITRLQLKPINPNIDLVLIARHYTPGEEFSCLIKDTQNLIKILQKAP